MKGLILNDFLSMRKLMKSILFVFVVFGVVWGTMDQAATGAIVICVMGISYLFNLFSYDEYYHWEEYVSILPLTRKQIVLARYMTFAVGSLMLLLISSVYTLIFEGISECMMMIFISLCMQGYSTAVIIPIAYKFGMQKGRMFYILLMMVPFGIVMGVSMALSESGILPTGEMMVLLLAGLIVLIALIVAVSIRVSVKIVSRKGY